MYEGLVFVLSPNEKLRAMFVGVGHQNHDQSIWDNFRKTCTSITADATLPSKRQPLVFGCHGSEEHGTGTHPHHEKDQADALDFYSTNTMIAASFVSSD
jgi:hypothetical protein